MIEKIVETVNAAALAEEGESPTQSPLSTAEGVKRLHLYLISDATGETLSSVAKAAMSQFPDVAAMLHVSFMVRTRNQIERALDMASSTGGIILYTLVNTDLRLAVDEGALARQVPVINVLDPVIQSLATYLGTPASALPGRQHALDAEYFRRIEAMNYTLAHDDGQNPQGLHEADVILVGVSRTSKTPTAVYLANRGIKAANIPVVPGVPLPPELFQATEPLVVGLTTAPDRLVQIRRHRMILLGQNSDTDYVDIDAIGQELTDARRLFVKHGWPVIDVSRRSIEETSAAILNLYYDRLNLM
ncbi:kinase/pyrophosphorylase [Zavarzinia compransoris]|uniref:pyruvate, water dikinase regulatory protein n=1 Tax=Zavarzinia marina TaxID=2911065 RepID=UPI001F291C84|nr:pyruvate, water dikinase regulatory protein [Zavarzinia marina]MCF4166828.1 kinase/pyrophosphorylase [Zavarzinia marina]